MSFGCMMALLLFMMTLDVVFWDSFELFGFAMVKHKIKDNDLSDPLMFDNSI